MRVQPKRVAGKDGQGATDRGNNRTDKGAAGSWTRDNQGRPRVFYHGTADDFSTFDLYQQNRKDDGWRGRVQASDLKRKYRTLLRLEKDL